MRFGCHLSLIARRRTVGYDGGHEAKRAPQITIPAHPRPYWLRCGTNGRTERSEALRGEAPQALPVEGALSPINCLHSQLVDGEDRLLDEVHHAPGFFDAQILLPALQNERQVLEASRVRLGAVHHSAHEAGEFVLRVLAH